MGTKKIFLAIYCLLIIGLFLPIVQSVYSLSTEEPLKGWIQKVPNVEFSLLGWFSGEYQAKKGNYLKSNFGFRPTLVRINNQYDYSLFKESNVNGCVIGKDEYLYELNYIKAYNGTDFIGQKEVDSKVSKLSFIQKQLKSMNKEIVVLLAPGKGSFYPEYIAENMLTETNINANYKAYSSALKASNINLLDYHKWFIDQKDKHEYPLYPKSGIHWSRYGEVLVLDSLIDYLGNLTDINTPDIQIDTVLSSAVKQYRDYDIAGGLNKIWNTDNTIMGYPKYHIEQDSTNKQPKVLFVSDSFYWGIHNDGLTRDLFGDGQFWYYNEMIYSTELNNVNVEDVDRIKELEKHDIVVLLSTDANLYKFAFGFIDDIYDLYKKSPKTH